MEDNSELEDLQENQVEHKYEPDDSITVSVQKSVDPAVGRITDIVPSIEDNMLFYGSALNSDFCAKYRVSLYPGELLRIGCSNNVNDIRRVVNIVIIVKTSVINRVLYIGKNNVGNNIIPEDRMLIIDPQTMISFSATGGVKYDRVKLDVYVLVNHVSIPKDYMFAEKHSAADLINSDRPSLLPNTLQALDKGYMSHSQFNEYCKEISTLTNMIPELSAIILDYPNEIHTLSKSIPAGVHHYDYQIITQPIGISIDLFNLVVDRVLDGVVLIPLDCNDKPFKVKDHSTLGLNVISWFGQKYDFLPFDEMININRAVCGMPLLKDDDNLVYSMMFGNNNYDVYHQDRPPSLFIPDRYCRPYLSLRADSGPSLATKYKVILLLRNKGHGSKPWYSVYTI